MNKEHYILKVIFLILSFVFLIYSIYQIVSFIKRQFIGPPTNYLLFILSILAIWKLLTEKVDDNEE
ncbi:hypothetical protein [Neobacillus mesonae]|uniref:Uncharacterized protein n=1 Tax=Neobacillus mesonae TaxID=1193713 RepID=A0A3Q9QSZ2_9BACI|nr:hypothetical protein [Neobacillus mesonae]AZU62483.1 hypothetical protein CHR53_15015 [Neobacillus mesonae]